MYCDEPLQFSIPCEKLHFTYIYPSKWDVQVKKTAKDEESFLVKSSGPRKKTSQFTYKVGNIPAVIKEPLGPSFKEMARYAEIDITHWQLSKVYYEGPSNWNKLGRSFSNLVIKNDNFIPVRENSVTKDLTEHLEEPGCQTGGGRHLLCKTKSRLTAAPDPGKFGKVLSTRKGNPVVNTALAMRLIRTAGIKARFIMIHSSEDGYFDPEFYSLRQFYMPALLAQAAGRSYVVFPHIRGLPIDHIPEIFQGQAALLIGASGHTKLRLIPSGNLAENATEEHYELTLNENGKIKVVEKKILNGSFAFAARQTFKDLNDQEQDEAAAEMLTYSEGDVTLHDKQLENLHDVRKPLVLTLTYEIANLLTVSPNEILFQYRRIVDPPLPVRATRWTSPKGKIQS